MGAQKWARIPIKIPPSPTHTHAHPRIPTVIPLQLIYSRALSLALRTFMHKNTLCKEETPFGSKIQNTLFFFVSPLCLSSFSNHSLPFFPFPFSLSAHASLRAIEQCFSACAGFSDFPGASLIWKLNDSTQCQNSWGTIPVLAVLAFFAFFIY